MDESYLEWLIGLPGFGEEKARRVAERIPSFEQLRAATREGLSAVEGVTSADLETLIGLLSVGTGRAWRALPLPRMRVVRRERGDNVSVLRRGIRCLRGLGIVGTDRRFRRRGRRPRSDVSHVWRRDGPRRDEVRHVRSSIHLRRTRAAPRIPAEPRRELAHLSAMRRIPFLR